MTEAEVRVIASSDVGVVVSLRWRSKADNEVHLQYQALKLRDGLVFEQDYREERTARRAIRAKS